MLGTKTKILDELVLSTNSIPGIITNLTVKSVKSNGAAAKISVSVGGVNFGETLSISSTAEDKVFSGSATGEIKVIIEPGRQSDATSGAYVYLKGLEVEYSITSAGPVDYNCGITGEELTMTIGEEYALASPAPEITYSFEPANIVKVENGKIIALAAGETIMTGKWGANDTWNAGELNVLVTVNKKTYTTGLENSIELEVGETATIAAGYPAGMLSEVKPEGVVTFADGTITAVTPGTAEVVLVWGDDEFEEGEATINVTVITPRKNPEISFAEEALTFTLGEDTEVGATVAGQKFVAPEDCTVSYKSDNTKVVTVAEDGQLTIVGAGTATVTATVAEDATYYTASKSYTVTVIDPNTVTFDFTTAATNYGWTALSGTINEYYSYNVTEGVVTFSATSARYWAGSPNHMRIYGAEKDRSTVKLSVLDGYAISEVSISGFNFDETNFTFNPSTGSLSGNQKWVAATGETVTEFSFQFASTSNSGNRKINSISVTVRPVPQTPELHEDCTWPSVITPGYALTYVVKRGFIKVIEVENTTDNAPMRAAAEQGEAPANWEYSADGKSATYTHPADATSLPAYDVLNVLNGEESVPVRLVFNADGSVSGISDVTADDEAAEYYNLQGVRVENPESGLYIRRQGNTYTKVLVK